MSHRLSYRPIWWRPFFSQHWHFSGDSRACSEDASELRATTQYGKRCISWDFRILTWQMTIPEGWPLDQNRGTFSSAHPTPLQIQYYITQWQERLCSEATSIKLSVGHQMLSCIRDIRITECSKQYPPHWRQFFSVTFGYNSTLNMFLSFVLWYLITGTRIIYPGTREVIIAGARSDMGLCFPRVTMLDLR